MDERLKLEGEVAVITGAGSGIGRAGALLLAEEGAKVVVVDYEQEGGEEARALGRIGEPREVACVALFLSSEESSFVTGVILSVGGGKPYCRSGK